MKINLTDSQYKKLVDLVYAGTMVFNESRETDKNIQEYEELEQYIYSFAQDFNLENVIEYDEKYERFFTTKEYDEGEIEQYLDRYDSAVFWGSLAFHLAKRDAYMKLEGKDEVERDAILQILLEKEAEYNHEFSENGIENLQVNKVKNKEKE